MKEYLDLWKHYADFSGRTTVRGFWMAYLFNWIITFGLGLILPLVGLGFLSYLYTLAVVIPSLAIAVRRLRDAGCHWANIFWPAVPIAGIIVYIVKLCKPSV